jgi:hypothetical protein
MCRQLLSDDIVNVPVGGANNGCRASRFRGNNTFLLFLFVEIGEVVVERDPKVSCVREVASVSFTDIPGWWDVSVRAIF